MLSDFLIVVFVIFSYYIVLGKSEFLKIWSFKSPSSYFVYIYAFWGIFNLIIFLIKQIWYL